MLAILPALLIGAAVWATMGQLRSTKPATARQIERAIK
jgi:hypothetical protein